MAKLVLQDGDGAGQEFALVEGLNRIGRTPGNEIRIDDVTVSTTHCELWLMKERLLLRDLDSTNGTFVDGRAISEAEVQQGDVLSVGRVLLLVADAPGRVAIPKPPSPPPPPPRFTPEGEPCCVNHPLLPALFRCAKCGEQFCRDCVRFLARRGGTPHSYCPVCGGECVSVLPPGGAVRRPASKRAGWLAKLTQTLRIRR